MIELVEKTLNTTYRACGYLASIFIVLILASVVTNIVDRIFGGYTAGTNEFASYCVAASGALGLAYAFGQNKHIRMSLLINRTQGTVHKTMEVICLIIAIGLSSFISFYVVKMVFVSASLNDRSIGTDALLLWIPQVPMALGFLVFSLALIHTLFNVLFKQSDDEQ